MGATLSREKIHCGRETCSVPKLTQSAAEGCYISGAWYCCDGCHTNGQHDAACSHKKQVKVEPVARRPLEKTETDKKEEQLDKIRTLFTRGDTDANGKLDFEEFTVVADKLFRGGLDPNKAYKLFKACDIDKSGYIEVDEFLEWVLKPPKKKSSPREGSVEDDTSRRDPEGKKKQKTKKSSRASPRGDARLAGLSNTVLAPGYWDPEPPVAAPSGHLQIPESKR
eukprot:TRINITY_DN4573_c1_g2_i1.p1 TRINITY_DN4573_c1_g2~~TRINITY_DN4573_c1_g2_i1.p1  ORF type:complete len:260 (+),score=39.95 TRINITY_DN4573_c1_g2_i1:111-782(+)